MRFEKITISGKIASGKTTLFWNLFRALHWPTFSVGQFFRDYAQLRNVDIFKAQEQEEEITREIDFAIRDLLTKHTQVIVEGWLAGVMAKDIPGVLRVFLTCEDTIRAKRDSVRCGVSARQARHSIQGREEKWLQKIHEIHGIGDLFDASHYDLYLDTSRQDPQDVFTQVMEKLHSSET